MDEAVARSIARWPDVPAVYGWLALDRRGNWRIKGGRISNAALREFIGRNYEADAKGRWYFQNGPQRVYVSLAYAPLVVHLEAGGLVDHCGRPYAPRESFLDDEGSVLFAGGPGAALLDDRDLIHYADRAAELTPLMRGDAERRLGFVAEPRPD